VFDSISHYVFSCGWLLAPAILWNIALSKRLPPAFQPSVFWNNIPRPLGLAENTLRIAVFALPFFMPLELAATAATPALAVFALGNLLYFSSWLALMANPDSRWSKSALGFAAPSYTPVIWLLGISLLGQKLYWGTFYHWWMHFILCIAFLAAHISHTLLVHRRHVDSLRQGNQEQTIAG
jgi:hypothetical protein